MRRDLNSALRFYRQATHYVDKSGLTHELTWQRNLRFGQFTETQLLEEAAWVVLCSGFREVVVRRVFNHISLSFCDWETAASIVACKDVCRSAALGIFNNERKINALVQIAELIDGIGFALFKQAILQDPLAALQSLPFIGSITSLHLAKNLGLDIAKPDRHLVRLAERFGFECTEELCQEVSRATGEQVKVIDLILWRYMADQGETRSPAC